MCVCVCVYVCNMYQNPNDENATANFQALQRVYDVLSDPERRKLYDETGCVDGEGTEANIHTHTHTHSLTGRADVLRMGIPFIE